MSQINGETNNLNQQTGITGKMEIIMMQFIMIAPCFYMRLSLDNDAYWIIQCGRYVIHHGIPNMDPLTFHEGLHYVMQQWLTAVIYAHLYDTFGPIGLFVFVMAIFIAIILIMFRLCLVISENNVFISYVITILEVIVLYLFMTTRPYPISMLIFLIEIFLLEKYLHGFDGRYLIGIPILSLFLINLHGAIWPFFFIIFIPYFIDSFRFKVAFIKGEGYPKQKMLVAFGLAFIAGFLNPYGWQLMTYLFRSYGNSSISKYVFEMRSPDFQNWSGIYVFGVLFLVVLVLILGKPPKLKLRYALLILGTTYMTLSSMRNLSLFAICGFPMIVYTLREMNPKFPTTKKIHPNRQKMLIGLFLAIVLFTASIRLYESEKWQDFGAPSNAVSYIIEHYEKENIRLFTSYNWGGYAEFRGLKPFIDARAEVFIKKNNKKADILDDLIALDAGTLHYSEFIAQYNLDVFLVEKEDLLGVYLAEDSKYTLVYHDKKFRVYQKNGLI